MTWSKFDDLYDEHEKVEEAWEREPRAVGLHVMATTHCNRLLTDGVIRPRWLLRKLPVKRERDRVLRLMVDVGLFDLLPAREQRDVQDRHGDVVTLGPFDEDRYVVHDFLDRHDSRERVQSRRTEKAAAGRRGGLASGRSRREAHDEAECFKQGEAPRRTPDPTRPDPTTSPPDLPGGEELPEPPSSGRKRDRDRWFEQLAAFSAQHFPGVDVAEVEFEAGMLRGARHPVTTETVRQRLAVRHEHLREAA